MTISMKDALLRVH